MELMTIGYEGMNQNEFFDLLKINAVNTLIDIRELPLSRKPGFSKTALSIECERQHLKYIHVSVLGCPREIRHTYRADKDWSSFTKKYLAYLSTQKNELQDLAEKITFERCCLMCFEADAFHCHRTFVADWLKYYAPLPVSIMNLALAAKEKIAWPEPQVDKLDRRLTIDVETYACCP